MNRIPRGWLVSLTLLSIAAALPPLSNLLMCMMLTHMLVQIPLLFLCATAWSLRTRWSTGARWQEWNAQGAPGLLFSALVLTFWMTPIALDHATSDSSWEAAKVASLVGAGFAAGVSWRLGSAVIRIFYVGNMFWMTVTAGMLYQESTQRLCNAYLWDDQTFTGQALVMVSIVIALAWTAQLAGSSGSRHTVRTVGSSVHEPPTKPVPR